MKRLLILLCISIIAVSCLVYAVNAKPHSINMESVEYIEPNFYEFNGTVLETKERETVTLRPAHYKKVSTDKVLIMGNSLSVGMSYVDDDKYNFIAKNSATLKSTRQEGRYEQINDYEFDTVIICFGTNALYWNLDTWRYEFDILFEEIYKANPNADIVITTPPPVSQEVSDNNKTVNNKNVKRCSQYLKQIADENDVYYLDNSRLFGDVLSDDISSDGVHLNSKWYKIWLDFMIEEAGKMERIVFDDL